MLSKSTHSGLCKTHCKSIIHKQTTKAPLHRLLHPIARLDFLNICEQCNATRPTPLHRLLHPIARLDFLNICEQCNVTCGVALFTDLSIFYFFFMIVSLNFFLFPVTFFHFLPLAGSLSRKYRRARRRWLGSWRSR